MSPMYSQNDIWITIYHTWLPLQKENQVPTMRSQTYRMVGYGVFINLPYFLRYSICVDFN